MFGAELSRLRDELQSKIEQNSSLQEQVQTLQSEIKTERTRLQSELKVKSEEHTIVKNQLQGQIDENKQLQSQLCAVQLEVKGKGLSSFVFFKGCPVVEISVQQVILIIASIKLHVSYCFLLKRREPRKD